MLSVPFPSNPKLRSKYFWNVCRRKFFFLLNFPHPFYSFFFLSFSLFVIHCIGSLFLSFGIPGRCTLTLTFEAKGGRKGEEKHEKFLGILVTRAVVSNYIVIQIYCERCYNFEYSERCLYESEKNNISTKVGRHFYVYHSMTRIFQIRID